MSVPASEIRSSGEGKPRHVRHSWRGNDKCGFKPCGRKATLAIYFLNANDTIQSGPFPVVCEIHANPETWEW